MGDCPNAEIRDLLPELVHGALTPAMRSRVEAHVATCADCAAELELLRVVRSALGTAPEVDVARIERAAHAAVPTPVNDAPTSAAPRRVGWRVPLAAAACAVLALGLVERAGRVEPSTHAPDMTRTTTAVLPGLTQPAPTTAQRTAASPAAPAQATGAAIGGLLAGLTTDELEELLRGLDELDALPAAEPDPVMTTMTEELESQ